MQIKQWNNQWNDWSLLRALTTRGQTLEAGAATSPQALG